MVLMYADPAATAAMTAEQRAEVFARHEALHRDLADTGELLNGAGLAYPADTTVLRLHDEAPVPSDGPLTAAPVHLTAYYVLDCASPERAREIAGRVVDFHVVAVEVRPVHDSFGMGPSDDG
ncbi:YciI family protein [Streptomyces sp. NRRL B-24484]|uniref:YciI family protein n=1 Tax=Streptomyces sp. NRRL B-24484 TaxID=1463833 RepID=UPI000693DB2B|nr:YciI family protein [Streptomyces sp. NRRL B-24484]